MPLFMDRHNVDGVTPEALAEAHARDLAVRAFLGDFEQGPAVMESARPNGAPVDRAFRAILFTDLAGSTAMTGDLGDEHALGLLRKHNAIVREKLNTHAGWEVKHTGDGFLASFAS